MVEKLIPVINQFVDEKGDFSLVMLIPTEPGLIDSKFTLLISAPWLDKEDPKRAIELIAESLRTYFNSEELILFITRITIINSADNFVKAINSAFSVKGGIVDIINTDIFGIQIERAILLVSHRVDD